MDVIFSRDLFGEESEAEILGARISSGTQVERGKRINIFIESRNRILDAAVSLAWGHTEPHNRVIYSNALLHMMYGRA